MSAQSGDKLKYSWFRCVVVSLLLLCVSKEKSGARRELKDSVALCGVAGCFNEHSESTLEMVSCLEGEFGLHGKC